MLRCCHSVLACANDALHLSMKLSSDVHLLTGLNSVPNICTGNHLHLYTLLTLVVCSMFRACMAPFIANNTAGIDSYKWILFGDDDTVFYVDNALRMLETLDHTMPYILSDHIWFPTDLKGMPHLLRLLCLYAVSRKLSDIESRSHWRLWTIACHTFLHMHYISTSSYTGSRNAK